MISVTPGREETDESQEQGGNPMARSGREWSISEGQEVMTIDGGRIGRVIAVEEGHLVVEEGRLFPTDHVVPIRAVADVADGTVHLRVTRDVVLERDWDAALPLVEAEAAAESEDVVVLGSVPVREGGEATIRVPVHEEELVPVTEERQIGNVQLNKQVVVEERVVEVPVVEERLRITRHPVDRDPDVADDAFTEGSIAIPIRGDEIGLAKRARVAEEVEIAKEAVQVTEQVAGTVRREEVHIESVELPAGSPAIDTGEDADGTVTLSTPAATADEVESVGTVEMAEPANPSVTPTAARIAEPTETDDAPVVTGSTSRARSGSTRSAKRSKRKKR